MIKNDAGQAIGWTITAETKEENVVVGTIRDLQFFGMDETAIKYDGRRETPEGNLILGWKQARYKKENDVDYFPPQS